MIYNLFILLSKHFYNLIQWQDKLQSRFTAAITWDCNITSNSSTWTNSTSTATIYSLGNILRLNFFSKKTSNFSTGNITNVDMPTITMSRISTDQYNLYEKLYGINSVQTIFNNIRIGEFTTIKPVYSLSISDGGLKSLSCPAPTVGTYDSNKNRYFTFTPSVNAVQTADAYAHLIANTVGIFDSINPYTSASLRG